MDESNALSEKAAKLIDLARKHFCTGTEQLTEAEKRLFKAVADGEEADLSDLTMSDGHPWTPPDNKPWPGSVAIPADRIKWLCTDKEARELITHKGIHVNGARFSGLLDLAFIDILFPLGLLQCSIPGGIDLLQAEIKALALSGSRTGPIQADDLKVKGGVFLREDSKHRAFAAQGEVRLLGADIGGDLSCIGGKFLNPGGYALSADGFTVKGNVFLSRSFEAQGEVRLLGANIGGNLECDDGKFLNPGKDTKALNADGLTVKGAAYLRDQFRAEGRVSLFGANIGLVLGLTRNDPAVQCLLDLRNASIGTLYDDATPWPAQLELDGFVYAHIDDRSPKDAAIRLAWLKRQPDDRFRPQPYEQLAKVLREAGHEREAKKILIAKGDAARNHAWKEGHFLKALWQALLGLVLGYGYRLARGAFLGLLFLLLVGWAMFHASYQADIMTPVKQRSYLISAERQENVSQKLAWHDYPEFNAFIYSLDSLAPLVDLKQEEYWAPSPEKSGQYRGIPVAGRFAWGYYWVHVCLGWLFTTLGVAVLTGLIKK